MKKIERHEFGRREFARLAPEGWELIQNDHVGQGAQSGICVVQRGDGEKGVFRCLLPNPSQTAVARFHRDLGILSTIEHPNVARLLDYTRSPDDHWYITRLGTPLGCYWNAVERKCGTPAEKVKAAVRLVRQIAAGLAECHSRGVVHRDIKPANIIVYGEGDQAWPALIDFGVAFVQEDGRITSIDEAVGNARYAPDAMRDSQGEVLPWFDVFELMQVLIWMVWERPPKHFWKRPVHWRFVDYGPGLPQPVERSLRAVTALCSHEQTAPRGGGELVTLLDKFFREQENVVEDLGLRISQVEEGQRVALAEDALLRAKDIEVVESAAPAMERCYLAVKEAVERHLNASPRSLWRTVTDVPFMEFVGSVHHPQRRTIEATLFEVEFGETAFFRFRIGCCVFLPSLRPRMNLPILPVESGPIAVALQRYADPSPARFPSVTCWVTLDRSGNMLLSNEGSNHGEQVTPEIVADRIRELCSDSRAWEAISRQY